MPDAARCADPAPDSLVLASASPRRRELLAGAGLRFEVLPTHLPEERRPGEEPSALARRLAGEKAREAARRLGPDPPRRVLGADTIVVIGDEVLGKPDDAEHAVSLLGRLVGRTHRVITGVALVESASGRVRDLHVESRVVMRDACEEEIRAYVAGGEPLDKAGAYALQGEGRRFVVRVEGSESNVIGLPLEEALALLEHCP